MGAPMSRRRTPLLLAGLALLAAGTAAAEPRILVLDRGGDRADEDALVESLRIYTGDLGCTIVPEGGAPAAPTSEAMAAIDAEARAADATMTVWFATADGARVLYAFVTASRQLQRTAVGGDDREVMALTLALKIRALYAHAVAAPSVPSETKDRTPIPPAVPLPEWSAEELPPLPPPPTASKTGLDDDPAAPKAAPRPTPPASEAPAPTRPTRLEGTIAYTFDVNPAASGWLRNGALARLAVPLPRAPIALSLDGGFTLRSGAAPVGTVTVIDVPVALAATWRWRISRFAFALGPRLALHTFLTGASTPDLRGLARTLFSAGLGGVAEARIAVTDWLAFAIDLHAEALLPRHVLQTDGRDAVDLGAFQLGATIGAVFRLF